MKYIPLLILCLLFNAVKAQTYNFKITTERNSTRGIDFNYTKDVEGTFLVKVKLENAMNVFESEYEATVSQRSGRLFTVYPAEKNQTVTFTTYKCSFTRGVPDPKIAPKFVYALPFPCNSKFKMSFMTNLSQQYFGINKIENFTAFKFTSNVNDTACAIRKGIVVSIKDKYQADLTVTRSYTSDVNSILIEQPDGTLASYSGFKQGAIFVKEGQIVYPFTPLGLLTPYDALGEFQIRLMIYYNKNIEQEELIPGNKSLRTTQTSVGYINPYFFTDKGVTKLSRGVYQSTFNTAVLDAEMNKKELKAFGFQSHAPKKFVYAQVHNKTGPDTTYLNQYGKEILSLSDASSFTVKWTDPGDQHKRNFQTFYRSGKLKNEYSYTDKLDEADPKNFYWRFNDEETGSLWVMHGPNRMWYENGQLKRDVTFKYGNVSGKVITYWDNNKIKRTNVDEKGRLTTERCFNRDGKEVPAYMIALAGAFRSGRNSVSQYLDSVIVYPSEAIANGLEGVVEAKISIDTLGVVRDVEISNSLHPLLDNELKLALINMPKWRPWVMDGETYSVNIPIMYRFKLPVIAKTNVMPNLITADTTYYNVKGQIVSSLKEASTYEVLTPASNDSSRLLEKIYFVSGRLKSEKYFLKSSFDTQIKDSVAGLNNIRLRSDMEENQHVRISDGLYREWYENGLNCKTIHYNAGQKDGVLTFYWENGIVRRKDYYKDGALIEGACFDRQGNSIPYFSADANASFPGGDALLMEYITRNLRYPGKAKHQKVEETIVVHFIVGNGGGITRVWFAKGKNTELIREAMRLIRTMPKWSPAFKDGEPIASYHTLPVMFTLNNVNGQK